MMITRSSFAASVCLLVALPHSVQGYSVPLKQGLEARVCVDRDCLTDGSADTLALVQTLAKDKDITVSKCGCLGPCGSGPNVDLRKDGVRVKDSRQDNYFIFRNIDSAESAAEMLRIAGVPVEEDSLVEVKGSLREPASTRKWYDLDRNSKINVQRLLYAVTALPLLTAKLNGTWDDSYYVFAGAVFVLSQFMGTGKNANAMDETD